MAQTLSEAQTGAGQDPSTGHETIVVLDFGSQFSMLIARRLSSANVRVIRHRALERLRVCVTGESK